MALSTFTVLYNHCYYPCPELFIIYMHQTITPPPPTLTPPGNTVLISVSSGLYRIKNTYKGMERVWRDETSYFIHGHMKVSSFKKFFYFLKISAFFFFFFFLSFVFLVVVVVIVAISWAAPAAYGGSQARG